MVRTDIFVDHDGISEFVQTVALPYAPNVGETLLINDTDKGQCRVKVFARELDATDESQITLKLYTDYAQ